ncbi:universal stress protein [Mycobacterium sp. ITM-2017-0098]|nr:universal stress protein [Mycobacterium sp. ITM-2017-0098]
MPTSVMVGYDGSPAAAAAINAAAILFPDAHAWVAHIWTPPFDSRRLRRRLRARAHSAEDLVQLLELEGQREADAIAGYGVALATAAEWVAEPLVKRSAGSDGLRLSQLAEKLGTDVIVIGDRGLDGSKAVIGSVSDMVVHYASVPVLVVPNPLLTDEFEALADGPVLVGYDGSQGGETAVENARRLFPQRRLLLAAVGGDHGNVSIGPAAEGLDVVTLSEPHRFGTPRDDAVADALIACADRNDAAVVVVGSRGRSAAREVLLGSVAIATVQRSHRPVLVAHG